MWFATRRLARLWIRGPRPAPHVGQAAPSPASASTAADRSWTLLPTSAPPFSPAPTLRRHGDRGFCLKLCPAAHARSWLLSAFRPAITRSHPSGPLSALALTRRRVCAVRSFPAAALGCLLFPSQARHLSDPSPAACCVSVTTHAGQRSFAVPTQALPSPLVPRGSGATRRYFVGRVAPRRSNRMESGIA